MIIMRKKMGTCKREASATYESDGRWPPVKQERWASLRRLPCAGDQVVSVLYDAINIRWSTDLTVFQKKLTWRGPSKKLFLK